MQFSTLLPIALSLSATAYAAPTPQTIVHPNTPVCLSITNYESGCSPAACTYSFTVSTPPSPPGAFGPAFSGSCAGNDIQDKYVNCTVEGVSANVVPLDQGLVLYIENLPVVGDETMVWVGNVTVAGSGEAAGEGDYNVDMYAFGELAF